MKLEKISAVAELVSSVAIVATLAYLAVQTQQNTQALQANARQASLDSELALLLEVVDKPILYQAPPLNLPNTNLSDLELNQIAAYNVAMLRTRESYWLQYKSGALDEELWESYRSVIVRDIREVARVRQVWEIFSDQFDPEFVEEVNSYLAD